MLRENSNAKLPHDLCIAHSLIDAGEGAHGFLHHLFAHAEHVVLLEELIRQLCHTQARVNLLYTQYMPKSNRLQMFLCPPVIEFVTQWFL